MFNPYRIASSAGPESWPAARIVRLGARGGTALTMIWDGAAYDQRFTRLTLIEAEMKAIETPHVEWHLGRILLMQLHGVPLEAIIWVTNEPLVGALVRVLERWSAVQLAALTGPPAPPMEVRLHDGTLVRRIGGGRRNSMRRVRWAR